MADPPSSDQAPEPTDGQPPGETAPSEIFEDRVLMKADGVVDALAERLRDALSRSSGGAQALVLCALIRPIGVRAAAGPSAPTPARLVLPDGAAERLGADLETHLTVGAGRVRLWLAGFERVPIGSTIKLVACGADGRIVEASVVVGDEPSPIHISIPWDEEAPPEAIALGFD